MSTITEPGAAKTAGKGGILMRLHRDRRGLASVEFVLAAPVILLIVLAVKQANIVSVKRMDTMREMRNAAFAEASGLDCITTFNSLFPIPALPALPGQDQDSLTCDSRPSHEVDGEPQRTSIWDDVNRVASDADATANIAGDLAEEKPRLIIASATRVHKFSSRKEIKPIRWNDNFVVDDQTLFTSNDNDRTRRGYDPTLQQEVRGVSDGAGDLFDGLFPGAN
ncbi:TadE/TadG family type IV pilus assembly protein [Neorhizobium galegae]|uniref:TadE/TadG family type IV pilus assembly protein n=1 Tax=Neorhizobium galegae TaxID=399 RepID=UPI0012D57D01|nr:TadE family protein [Neorhizobium galegae]KAB1122704.1 pilus assembly protein [Neorhizobium galegae]MCQ1570298.1 pilus assembly protein [Neorhizobium galegae]MCQ1807861.1 pilus assembly protein [Neorhizobium galegae]UIY31851.1 pilus assembly protein [Neorhizobium galegae]